MLYLVKNSRALRFLNPRPRNGTYIELDESTAHKYARTGALLRARTQPKEIVKETPKKENENVQKPKKQNRKKSGK